MCVRDYPEEVRRLNPGSACPRRPMYWVYFTNSTAAKIPPTATMETALMMTYRIQRSFFDDDSIGLAFI